MEEVDVVASRPMFRIWRSAPDFSKVLNLRSCRGKVVAYWSQPPLVGAGHELRPASWIGGHTTGALETTGCASRPSAWNPTVSAYGTVLDRTSAQSETTMDRVTDGPHCIDGTATMQARRFRRRIEAYGIEAVMACETYHSGRSLKRAEAVRRQRTCRLGECQIPGRRLCSGARSTATSLARRSAEGRSAPRRGAAQPNASLLRARWTFETRSDWLLRCLCWSSA